MGLNKEIQFSLPPEEAFDPDFVANFLNEQATKSGFSRSSIIKRSIDARKTVAVHFKALLFNDDGIEAGWKPEFPAINKDKRIIIIGSGPAGLFAAIRCLELGMLPIILERGKDVQSRRKDIADINKKSIVDTDSNYCFGEGGAGTYSDGKLYTRSSKRGSIRTILEVLHHHGARDEILFDAHPHIGTNKLPNIVKALRETIINSGGEIHFNSRVVDFVIDGDTIHSVVLASGEKIEGKAIVLATGHSARDIYELLANKSIFIESKPFALGVRVEHPQKLIDKIQYKCGNDRGPYLPASSYSLAHNLGSGSNKRGIFSFCMCPGGFIVPAGTSPGEIVVNGMSPSNRNSKFANSGIVVSVLPEDYSEFSAKGALAGMYFQQQIEQMAIREGFGLAAPTQRLRDFVYNKQSDALNPTSYQPGLYSAEFSKLLPKPYTEALKQAFKIFDNKMKGYLTNDAQLIGIESRTSSPVRITRDKTSLAHVQIRNLYPVGEGAGYAGGIVSAAMDGWNTLSMVK